MNRGNETDYSVEINGVLANCTMVQYNGNVHVFSNGSHDIFKHEVEKFDQQEESFGQDIVVSPMPCKIAHVFVKNGDLVEKGQQLLILEAMKMEHVIRAPKAGKIKSVVFKVGDVIGERKQLVVYE